MRAMCRRRSRAGALGASAALRDEIAAHLADRRGGEILRDGFRVVIAGPPNAGKSSLMNALARRDVAIVSEEAGTTRDVIEVRLDLGGFPVILMDTAGIREAAGDDRAGGYPAGAGPGAGRRSGALDRAMPPAPDDAARGARSRGAVLFEVVNKIDMVDRPAAGGALPLSVRTGEGLDRLIGKLTEAARQPPISARARRSHGRAIAGSWSAAPRRWAVSSPAISPTRAARRGFADAATALGRLTGRVDVEDILDKIFADFCIGK